MSEFKIFAKTVNNTLTQLQKNEMYVTEASGDELWDVYISAFPEGTNPIYKTNTEHQCSCCRNFVKNLGNSVAVIDGVIHTVWDDYKKLPYPYDIVAKTLSDFLKSKKIVSLYRTSENKYGAELTLQFLVEGGVINWNHFYGVVDSKHFTKSPDEARGKFNGMIDIFRRSLDEITIEALDTVLDLIKQNSLYRGQEFQAKVKNFRDVKVKYDKLKTESEKNLFIISSVNQNISHFKNEVIGTLVVELSEGVDVEKAVKAFESKVAPANYKRPTALITPKMVESAMQTIKDLDLEDALQRRFAMIEDVSVNNVLWVNKETQAKMKGGLEDILLKAAVKPKVKEDAAEEMTIDEFVEKILPKVTSVELMLKNSHAANFVSLTAPVHSGVSKLFKWNNDFAWSYSGNIADSDLRKAVQDRGGRVDGVFRFSHQWNYDKRNVSLMDLHVFMPGNPTKAENGVHDSYGNNNERVGWNHRKHSKSGGVQDVDYTSAAPVGYVPVENITFPDINRMPEGQYVCKIHNWSHRTPTEGGFKAEIEFAGQVFQYEYLPPLKNKEWVTVAVVTLKNGQFSIEHKLNHAASSNEVWGVQTETLVKVNTILNSPNYWDNNAVGNKHWFFILEGCKNDEPCRGIYNEFLRGDLEQHRKVFEVLGNKTKCNVAEKQLSGLGFSSTQKNSCTFVVKGDNIRKTVTVNF